MNDRRYDILEDYLRDLQADRPSAVFSKLGDDKELAVVLRTAKTVHLLTRRPCTNHDFAESLEGRLLVQAEDRVYVGKQRLRWGFALPALAVIGVSVIFVWQVVTPGSATGDVNLAEATTQVSAGPSRVIEVSAAEAGSAAAEADGDVWAELAALDQAVEEDFKEIETTMATIDTLFNAIDYGAAQVELTSMSY